MKLTSIRQNGKEIEVSEEDQRELLRLATGLTDEELDEIQFYENGGSDIEKVDDEKQSRFSITADDLQLSLTAEEKAKLVENEARASDGKWTSGGSSSASKLKKKARVSQADVYYGLGFPEKIDARAVELLGSDDPGVIASVVGAPDEATVEFRDYDYSVPYKDESGNTLYQDRHGLDISIEMKGVFRASRVVAKNSRGETYIKNEEFFIEKEHQGKGIGIQMFVDQVDNAVELGVKKIICHAARYNPQDEDNPFNGYYTWALFGYDAKLDPSIVIDEDAWIDLKQQFPEASRVSDLMKTEDGRQWWKKNGDDFQGEFDLTENSQSRRRLDEYTAERERRRKEKQDRTTA